MIFKFGRFLLIPVLILSVLVGVTGCADDLSPQFIETGRKPDGAYISVRIPLPTDEMQTRAATRADYALDENEGTINDLHLLLYESSSTTAPAISKSWSSAELSAFSIGEDGYLDETIVDLDLTKTYNLYVVANLEGQSYRDGGSFSANLTESALKNLVFDWTTQPTADNLPMVFTLEGIDPNQANDIIADMTIAAIKVRYNVVFDSRIFGSQADEKAAAMPKGLQITGVAVENVADRANVVKSTATSGLHSDAITHTGTHYDVSGKPATGNGAYYNANNIDNDGVVSDKINLAGLSEVTDFNSPWVYQGTIYLPERYAEEDDDPTSMTFAAEILDEEGYKISDTSFTIPNLAETGISMERGKYHEWVCMVASNGDALISEVTVRPWTSQNIVYTLHGAYELIVEVTESVEVLTGKWTTFGYSSDTDIRILDDNMPNITADGVTYPFYRVEIVTPETLDENGEPYEFTDEWPNHVRVSVNPDIPYYVL